MKEIIWVGSSLDDIRRFPDDARRIAGFELSAVQEGAMPSDFRPMSDVGSGVYEIRIRTGTAHRIFYVARFPEAVYVLHAFEKRSRTTARSDIEIGRKRYQDVIEYRRR